MASILRVDADGLWICDPCQKRLTNPPVGSGSPSDLPEELRALFGKSAGAICRTLELPVIPPYDTVIEAASQIAYDQDRYMSAWLFVEQWLDGTTLWRTEDGHTTAIVSPAGGIQIQEL